MLKAFNKRDISILLANLLDHFDGALYGFLAPIMAEVFFPEQDPVIRIILAYSLFATTLVTRPIGSIIFGYFARFYGPLRGMSFSLIGISIGSVLIALVPGYNVIGYKAAIILIIIRSLKGICSAGESTIAKLYILDGKDQAASYKASYIYQASSMAGIILASLCSTMVYLGEGPDLWRLCYIFAGIVGILAYILRCNSSLYDDKFDKQPIESITFELVWKYKYPILAVIFTTGLSHLTYLIPCVIMNSLVPFVTEIAISDMMEVNNMLLILDLIFILLIGQIISQYSYFKIKIFIPIIMSLTIPWLFMFMKDASMFYVTFARAWMVFLGVIYMIPQNIFYRDMFANFREKYLIVGMSNSIGAATIGKLSPVIMFYLYYQSGDLLSVALYMSFISVLAAFFVWKCKEIGL